MVAQFICLTLHQTRNQIRELADLATEAGVATEAGFSVDLLNYIAIQLDEYRTELIKGTRESKA